MEGCTPSVAKIQNRSSSTKMVVHCSQIRDCEHCNKKIQSSFKISRMNKSWHFNTSFSKIGYNSTEKYKSTSGSTECTDRKTSILVFFFFFFFEKLPYFSVNSSNILMNFSKKWKSLVFVISGLGTALYIYISNNNKPQMHLYLYSGANFLAGM